MKFGVLYEHQLPRPWDRDAENRVLQEALAAHCGDLAADGRRRIAGANAARLDGLARGVTVVDPLFRGLRRSQPVLATRHQGRPTFLITKYDDCLTALKDGETYSSHSNAEAGQVLGRTVLEMDGREHGRYLSVAEYRDGLIATWREYWNPADLGLGLSPASGVTVKPEVDRPRT